MKENSHYKVPKCLSYLVYALSEAKGMMKFMIGVFSYNVSHRKTYDVLCLLKAKGYQEVTVYAVPFHYEKKFYPLYSHRPPVLKYMPDTKTICDNFQYEYIDAGEIIERRIISLNFNDTFHSVAQRVYENEVGMLVEAIEKINEEHEIILPKNNPIYKRMPHSFETRLLERFEKIIKNVPIEENRDR